MLTLKNIVSLFQGNILDSIIKLLLEKNMLRTQVPETYLYLLTLSDDEFIEEYPDQYIVNKLIDSNKISNVTKLSLIYYLLDNIESKEYFSQNTSYYRILSSFSPPLPGEIWHNIYKQLPSVRDIVSLSSVSA